MSSSGTKDTAKFDILWYIENKLQNLIIKKVRY